IGEVAYIDELNRIGRAAWNDHLASQRDAHRPINEASGSITRTDNKPRPDDCHAARHSRLSGLFAQRFAATEVGVIFADLFSGRVLKCGQGRRLIEVWKGGIAVNRDG